MLEFKKVLFCTSNFLSDFYKIMMNQLNIHLWWQAVKKQANSNVYRWYKWQYIFRDVDYKPDPRAVGFFCAGKNVWSSTL